MITTSDTALKESLKKYFGFNKFKGEQEAIIQNVLDGNNTFVINALPTEGLNEAPTTFIEKFITSYVENVQTSSEIYENIAKAMAKHMSIKKGKSLSELEMQELIDQLFACEMPYVSPTGKKCFITFGLDELEKRFKS